MRLKCSRKIVLLILFVDVISSLYFICWLTQYFDPEDIECDVSNNNIAVINSQSEIELKLQMFLNNQPRITTSFKSQNWIHVAKYTYVYSVYYDGCPPGISSIYCVQFIGMTVNATDPRAVELHLKCAFKNSSLVLKDSPAFIERLPESHSLSFTAAFFYCDLKGLENKFFPEFVTLYDDHPTKWFPFPSVNFKNPSRLNSLSLCVRPLYGNFSSLYFTQFLTYYAITGVNHFIFYNHNASEFVLQFLNFLALKNELSIEIASWDIPLSNEEVHEYGQIVFTQDCFARSRYKYSHTLIVDLDEFVVPKRHHSISELLYYLNRYYPNAGSYVVPMVLFCDEYSSNGKSLLPILTHDKRQKTSWYHKYRSKYIARPDRIKVGGIHFTWTLKEDFSEVFLSPSLVLLHHYKSCCNIIQTWFFHLFSFPVLRDKTVIDNTLTERGSEILNHSLIKLVTNREIFSDSNT